MINILVCLLAGMGAGLGTGFAGLSAASVISPMLITFLGMNPYEAIGIALASDVLASAVSAYTYGKNKNIDLKNSKILFVTVIIFTLIGAIISHLVGTTTIGNIAVYMTFLMGINFLVKSVKEEKATVKNELLGIKKIILPILCGSAIGFVCGFMGVGGGILMLILLTKCLNYEVKTAVGTSVFIMTFTALFGATSHFVLSGIIPNLSILFLCVLSTLIFARIGSKYANNAAPKQLQKSIGIVLTSLGLLMILI